MKKTILIIVGLFILSAALGLLVYFTVSNSKIPIKAKLVMASDYKVE